MDVEAFRQEQDARNAELDEIPVNELRRQTVDVLDHAVRLLRSTPLNEELRRHGWSESLAEDLADEFAKISGQVQHGTYNGEWGGGGLT